MKKILILALGTCLLHAPSFGQKQTGGEKNFQVMFAPLGRNPVNISGISFRKFNSAGNAAWRVNLFLGFTHTDDYLSQADTGTTYPNNRPETHTKSSGMNISIRPGYEKHFAGTDRLSPYIGGELLFSITTLTVDSDGLVPNSTTYPTGYTVLTTTTKGKGSVLGNDVGTTYGVNLIAGTDYYIAKDLSLGVEFGWGFSSTLKADYKSQHVDYSDYTVKDNLTQKQGSAWTIAPNVIAQFKLGWLFGK